MTLYDRSDPLMKRIIALMCVLLLLPTLATAAEPLPLGGPAP